MNNAKGENQFARKCVSCVCAEDWVQNRPESISSVHILKYSLLWLPGDPLCSERPHVSRFRRAVSLFGSPLAPVASANKDSAVRKWTEGVWVGTGEAR